MVDRSRARRSPARYLAPLALAAVVVGVYAVVQGHGSSPKTSSSARAGRSAGAGSASSRRHERLLPKLYVVRPGDSLTGIAARTGVPLGNLQVLNPNVNPNALQVGQRLRLRR